MSLKPPSLFDSLLKWYCAQTELEDIQGDLYEIYEERAEISKRRANLLFAKDVLRLFLPFTKNKKRATWLSESYNFNLRNQIVVSLRYLKKYPFVNTLKIVGLGVAISAFLFISDYTRFHHNFDQFHEKKSRIYRIITKVTSPDLVDETAWSHAYIKELVDEFPAMEQVVRLLKSDQVKHVNVGEMNFEEHAVYHTDPEFAEVFTYNWIDGDPSTALEEPFSVVITDQTAHKYFSTEEGLLGQVIRINEESYKITGVIGGVPKNSDLQFDLLIPFPYYDFEDWSFVYLLLHPQVSIDQLSDGFAESILDWNDEFTSQGVFFKYEFENIADIHFSEPKLYDTPKVDKQRILLFQLIGVVILLIAIVNYVNLYTTQIMQRMSGINIRMVVGASKKHLFMQFVTDAFIYLGIALSIGIVLTIGVKQLMSLQTGFSFFSNPIPANYLFSAVVIFFLVLISIAIYGLALATRRSSLSLFEAKTVKAHFRKGLVGVQFALSFVMILSTVVIYRQTSLLQNEHLGFDGNDVITFQIPNYVQRHRITSFKKELGQLNFIQSVSQLNINSIPGMDPDIDDYYIDNSDERKLFEGIYVDESFLETLHLELVAGEFFSKKRNHRPHEVYVVNEAFVNHMGWSLDETLEKDIEIYSAGGRIIGVVKNFYFNSPHELIQPLILNYNVTGGLGLARLNAQTDFRTSIDRIELLWKDHLPNVPFDFSFLMTDYEEQFKQERATINVFAIIASLVIILSLLGMYAILLMLNEFREKELGIRKVNGATKRDLFQLFSKEFIKILTVSIAIAIPLLWYGMENWLAKYPLRVTLNPMYFILSAGLVMLVANGVIYLQAHKSYRAKTIDALKYE